MNKHLGGEAVPEKDAYDYAPWRRADRRAYVERLLVAQRTAHQDAAYASYYAFLNNMHTVDKEDVRSLLNDTVDVDYIDNCLLMVKPEYRAERFPPFLMLTRPGGALRAMRDDAIRVEQ